jgi:hypothetical protein
MIPPNDIENLRFSDLWEVFLAWRIAILEWPLSPKVVFDESDPIEVLEPIFQPLSDERYRVIERLLLKPDQDLRKAFTPKYADFIDAMHGGKTKPDWWMGQLEPWLKTFLRYAISTVPPNYRRNQLLLIPYDGTEPFKGSPPPLSLLQ